MKKSVFYPLFTLLWVLALLWPSTAYAKDLADDQVIFGGTYTLESGQTLDGSLVIFGGAVTTEPDSTVQGDVVLLGGVAEVGGVVTGSFVGIGGAVQLTESAIIEGDFVAIGATLNRAEGAQINGQIMNNLPFRFEAPQSPQTPGMPGTPHSPAVNVINPLVEIFWFFFRIFMWALLAVLVLIFFVQPAERVAKTAIRTPLIAGGAGLITAILTPFVLIALSLTIILIPVTAIALLVVLAAWFFGWIALGLEVGRRVGQLFNLEWAPAVAAGLGTLILSLVLGGLNEIVPCVGWIPQALVGMWGFGAVILTRFGTQDYPPASVGGSAPEAEILPPVIIPPAAGDDEPAP